MTYLPLLPAADVASKPNDTVERTQLIDRCTWLYDPNLT